MSRIVNLQTIYAEGRTIYEENKFLLNLSSNCKVVSIKANRICAECSCTLEKVLVVTLSTLKVREEVGCVSLAFQNLTLQRLVK